ncbi:MAG: nucleotidyltransferase family protein [Bacteroidales bacterium]|nr:nucleotidyltransferase family protein [Bacteroidales bacterium]
MNDLSIKHSALFIDENTSILNAIKHMDKTGKKLLIVTRENKFFSLVSIGDIQRAIIDNILLETPVNKILRRNIKVANKGDNIADIKNKMLEYRVEFMPVIDKNKNLVDIYLWEEIFSTDQKRKEVHINLPVVIMAGGEGTRLKPLTNVLPKPLIPIGEKTILEHILDKFVEIGSKNFFISVNYKADMIQHYFEALMNPDYQIIYFKEPKPLGTIGSLYLLKEKITQPFFVSNCDIIIEEDYGEIYNYHKENKNELTIVAALKHYPIPYGTIETGDNGILHSLTEKPELTFKINSGMYILEPHLISEIPENTFFHITDLIDKVKKRGGKVGVFPVSENSWKDIGDWDEYLSTAKIK